jgi:hypothetical protein
VAGEVDDVVGAVHGGSRRLADKPVAVKLELA